MTAGLHEHGSFPYNIKVIIIKSLLVEHVGGYDIVLGNTSISSTWLSSEVP